MVSHNKTEDFSHYGSGLVWKYPGVDEGSFTWSKQT